MVGLIVLFFLINLLLKSAHIQSTPPGATYDEIGYVAEAQSILQYGTDLKGTWAPWRLEPSDPSYTELTSTTLIPGFVLFPHNPVLASKVMPLVLGSLLPVLLALIVYFFIRKKSYFLAVAIVATVNPWAFQFSRMGFDSLFSVVFINIGIVLLLYLNGWKKIFSMIPFFWGFFQYQGHKPLLVPLALLTALFIIIKNIDSKKNIFRKIASKKYFTELVVVLLTIVLTVSYIVRLPHISSGQRSAEFTAVNEKEVSQTVNDNRRTTLTTPFVSIMDNKITAAADGLVKRFFYSFDVSVLFVQGNTAIDTFAVTEYGFFHLIDLALLILGIAISFKNRNFTLATSFVMIYILIGTIPNVLKTERAWITFRGAFVFLGLIQLAGIGFGYILEHKTTALRTVLVGMYLCSTLSFFYIYFFRYPITYTANHSFYERVVASYIKRQPNKTHLILPDRAEGTFKYLLAYNQPFSMENKNVIYEATKTGSFGLNNFSVLSRCPEEPPLIDNSTVILINSANAACPQLEEAQTEHIIEINSLLDSGTRYRLYGDTLCSSYQLQSYPSIKNNVLNIEQLSDQEFCTSFFTFRPVTFLRGT